MTNLNNRLNITFLLASIHALQTPFSYAWPHVFISVSTTHQRSITNFNNQLNFPPSPPSFTPASPSYLPKGPGAADEGEAVATELTGVTGGGVQPTLQTQAVHQRHAARTPARAQQLSFSVAYGSRGVLGLGGGLG